MPTFDTPEPVSVAIELAVGDARLTAGDRVDTVVEVLPRNSAKKADVKAANETTVDFAGGRLRIHGPKAGIFGSVGSIDVTIETPSKAQLDVDLAVGSLRANGTFGDCRVTSGVGNVHLTDAGALHVKTGAGDVTVGRVGGRAEVTTGSGDVQITRIDGSATIKNSNGRSWVGTVTGNVNAKSANGSIVVDSAHGTVSAKTANGSVRIGEVVRGSVLLESAMGEIEIGVRKGTAAWLDVSTKFGNVHNTLTQAAGPETSDETVEVRARTAYGDIVIHRTGRASK
ncbi:DUF4097 family beta strand repeat-containing protein [Antrihabitans sp. YC2-6]|uniref:DUF4097 family beta strand repeat-containing protein n=1 Tax=Antrihabitans sp. YC2-6 TaxID=2799498 RepID=UPI0018F46695|nr:DUF4097 family beta strand repeat-containing protein [Antrihabitans sp. YC2-6]MBJ8343709.1 DUF4097 family beta strand repeat protein [Antrihabitans sp. YC2-6]